MPDHVLVVPHLDDGVPRTTVLRRQARARSLRLAWRVDWTLHPGRYRRPTLYRGEQALDRLIWRRRVPLARDDPGAHDVLERGKRVNVALVAPSLDGLLLEPGAVLSFWRTVGRPTAALGFRHGMEVRGGCVVPSLGGGLCLLTNALFRAAAELGWTIVERHGHTMEVVPSGEDPWGVDATAAWPYVDLRFALPADRAPARLSVRVEADDVVVVEVWSSAPGPEVELTAVDDRVEELAGQRVRTNRIVRRVGDELETIAVNRKRLVPERDLGRSCLTCDLTDCAGRVVVR